MVNTFGLNPATADSNQNGIPDAFAKTTRRGREAATQIVTHNTLTFTPSGDCLIWPNSAACSLFYDLQTDTPGMHLLEVSAANWAAVTIPNYAFEFAVYANGVAVGTIAIPARANYGVATNHFMLPWFEPGTYRVQLVWLNRYVVDGLVDRPAIQRVRLLAIDNATDANQDGIADWMVPVLQASTADTDRDGLLDRDEVLIHRSNPLLADSDNDGLADFYEALTSHTALNNADTDGDGVSDVAELQLTGTDPLTAEFTNGWQTVTTRAGSDFVASAGPWHSSGSNAVAFARGWIEYEFNLADADVYILRVEAGHEWWNLTASGATPLSKSDFLISVDGQFVRRSFLDAPAGSNSTCYAALPYLRPGTHRVRLFWNAIDPSLNVHISAVSLGAFGGSDSDCDGVKDWVVAAARRANSADSVRFASAISPACLEGTARYPLLAAACSGTNAVAVCPGVAGRWYADLPLDPSGGATPLTVSFENGACVTNFAVSWTPLDLLAATRQTLRVGDTLLFTVCPPSGFSNGTASVSIDGAAPCYFTPGQSFTQRFAVATHHVLQATWTPEYGPATSRVVAVTVLAAPLPVDPPACLLGRTRNWTCTNVSAGVVLQGDADTAISWNGTNATLTVNTMYADHYLVARAGTDGPILTSRRLDTFWLQAAVDSYMRVVETRGTAQVWQDRLVSLGLPGTVTVKISIFVAGVTFDDLTIVRDLNAAQIGDPGDYRFNMIHPLSTLASSCHVVMAWQAGVVIGEAYYASIGLPYALR